MDDAIRDLMHRAIDGAVTDAEKERLQGILAGDPAARSEWQELGKLCRMLDEVPPVDPPEDWKRELLERIRERAAQSAAVALQPAGAAAYPARVAAPPSLAASPSRFAGALRRFWTPATGFAFVAGTAAGIALFATFGLWPSAMHVDGGSVPGALLGESHLEGGRLVGEARLDLGDTRVHATTRAAGRLARVEIEVRSESRADLEVEFDPAALHLQAFDQGDPSTGQVEVAAGRVHVQHLGRGRYWLWFACTPEGARVVAVRVRSADQTLERSLPVLRDSS